MVLSALAEILKEPLHGGTADLRRWYHQMRHARWCARHTQFRWPQIKRGVHKSEGPVHVNALSMDMGIRMASNVGQHEAQFFAEQWRVRMREQAKLDPPFKDSAVFQKWKEARQGLVREYDLDQDMPWAIVIYGDDPKFLAVSTKWYIRCLRTWDEVVSRYHV